MILVNGPFIERYQVFAKFVAYPPILRALARLGFPDAKFGHGRVISKPPYSPPLFWHEDGRFWNDPVSYTPVPIQANAGDARRTCLTMWYYPAFPACRT